MKTLFLAWQDSETRRWFPVGKLTYDDGIYRFRYTQGARMAQHERGFAGLPSFPELATTYESNRLFPLFSDRMPSGDDPYAEWLASAEDERDPMALLARGGPRKIGEKLEIFPCPEPDENGRYHIHFFSHGLRHFPQASIDRVERLMPGDTLLLVLDMQNPHDPRAIMLRTAETESNDIHLVGYCPRYLLDDALVLMLQTHASPTVTVQRVNPAPAPIQFRLLVRLTMVWPKGFRPFMSRSYLPIEEDVFSTRQTVREQTEAA